MMLLPHAWVETVSKNSESVEKVAKANNTHEVLIVSNEVCTNLVLILTVEKLL